MTALKSSYEIALEKMKKMDINDVQTLSEQEKSHIQKIKDEYNAKIAEKEILLKGQPELTEEINFLQRQRDEKINDYYSTLKKDND